MGMTFEEIIDCFIRLKDTIEEGENVEPATCEIYPVTVAFRKEDCIEVKEVVDSAISTMRKYQKITEIVEAWKADIDIDSYDCMTDIDEVVEDGTENNYHASNT